MTERALSAGRMLGGCWEDTVRFDSEDETVCSERWITSITTGVFIERQM